MKLSEILMVVFMIAVVVAGLVLGPRPVALFAAGVLVVALRGGRGRPDHYCRSEARAVAPATDRGE